MELKEWVLTHIDKVDDNVAEVYGEGKVFLGLRFTNIDEVPEVHSHHGLPKHPVTMVHPKVKVSLH